MGYKGDSRVTIYHNAYEIHLFWENNFDVDKCKELSILNIKQSIVRWMRDPIGALEFFCDKTAVQWLEPTYGSFYLHRI